jgi:hypothetical protein
MNSHLDSQATLSEAPPLGIDNNVVNVDSKNERVDDPSTSVYLRETSHRDSWVRCVKPSILNLSS